MKRALIFGAAGACGTDTTQKLLDLGWHVTAYVRTPSKLTVQHAELEVVQGDMLDKGAVESAMAAGHDVVISTVGRLHTKPSTDISDGTRNMLEAASKHGVPRFVVVSSLGVGGTSVHSFTGKLFQKLVLKESLKDKERQEQYVRDSGLDWTIIRPSRIDRKPAKGGFEVWEGPQPPRKLKWTTTRGDVADLTIQAITEERYVRQAINMSA